MADEPLRIDTDPSLADVQRLRDGLYEFNVKATGCSDGEELSITG